MELKFISGVKGPLFSAYHAPETRSAYRGEILFVHPFAEELNKSRRMVALQAREFAALGYGVLVPDLFGCGDSGGDFGDASWADWVADLTLCMHELRSRRSGPVHLWGLRLGCILAMEVLKTVSVERLILWQPILRGQLLLKQFLRLRVAAGLLGETAETTNGLMEILYSGRSLEIAGYQLNSALALALEGATLSVPPPHMLERVHWLEVTQGGEGRVAPASQQTVRLWIDNEVEVEATGIRGEPFWVTQEISVVEEFVRATTDCLRTFDSTDRGRR